MMSDVQCPYCDKNLEINHDDGYGYEEGTTHNQECRYCGKTFVYTTSISFDYTVKQAACLNEGKHDLQDIHGYPKEVFIGKKICSMCGEVFTVNAEANRQAVQKYVESLW
jgi:uncharacterized Zn-finger protein